jgi:ribosomal protein S27E
MMPPLLRRCPECGHVGLARRFAGSGEYVACPVCGFRFEPVDKPWLA